MPVTTPQSPFIPAGAVTGVGSLPLRSAASAISTVARFSPEIPFWPQLPRLSERESVIGQGLDILAGLVEPRSEGYGYEVKPGRMDAVMDCLHRSSGELTASNAVGFSALGTGLSSGLFPSALAVKGQIEGPITLSAYLFYKGRSFLSDPALFAAVAFHVSQMICWQLDRLEVAGLPVLLWVDEPALCLNTSLHAVPEEQRLHALAAILDDVRRQGALAGLHCCAARPFERMCCVRPDILSFDAHEGLESFFTNQQALHFIRQGGTVAYGIVPTWPSLQSLSATGLFTRWLQVASRAGDLQEIARRAILTATCGLGLLEAQAAAESFVMAQQVGRLVRKLAGVTSASRCYASGS